MSSKQLAPSNFAVIFEIPSEQQDAHLSGKVSVFLDCGTDSASLEVGDLLLEENIISILIPWQFEEGICLQVTFVTGKDQQPVDAETMVIESVPCQHKENRFHTTLLVIGTKARTKSSSTLPQPCESFQA